MVARRRAANLRISYVDVYHSSIMPYQDDRSIHSAHIFGMTGPQPTR
jgi:hypothetical protein